jgi:hypothetical protein
VAVKSKPKINVTKLMDLQEDTRLRSLKEQVDSGGEVRAAKRRKSKKSFSEIKAEIDAKKINKDKLLGTKGVQKTNALLMESNKILIDIASVISTDFTTRIEGEKQELRDLQSKRQKGEVAEKEGKLEGKGQSTNKISAAAQKMMQPIMGAFDKIKELVSIIGLGILGSGALEFLKDPANLEKVKGFFDFIAKHWKWVLGGLGVLVALKFVGPIITLVKVVRKAVKILLKFGKFVKNLPKRLRVTRKLIQRAFKKKFGTKVGTKIGTKIGQKVTKKVATKTATKVAVKSAGKGLGKSVLKKIPLVGLGLGAAFAIDRLRGGDWSGALMELGSGAASMIPGVGTAVSVALDAGLIAKDVVDAKNQEATEGGEVTARKTGGNISKGKPYLVGEGGPELFKPNISGSLLRAGATAETLKTLAEDESPNIIQMDLPAIKSAPPTVPTKSVPANEVELISPVNTLNEYMLVVPDLLGISV